jgi:hypothetical protein
MSPRSVIVLACLFLGVVPLLLAHARMDHLSLFG